MSSKILAGTNANETYSVVSTAYKPVIVTDSPTKAPFFTNYDGAGGDVDGNSDTCKVPEDEGAVYSVKDSKDNELAKFQYGVTINPDSIVIDSVDLCMSSKILAGTNANET